MSDDKTGANGDTIGTIEYGASPLYRYVAKAQDEALVLYDCIEAPLQLELPSVVARRVLLLLTMEIITT